MTDELKKDLLESNIQCINEYDGKFVFFHTEDEYALPKEVTLKTPKYPDVTFYANYFTDVPSPIYRFSSGIILDSSVETPQYKIVLATYNVNTSKVTFVDKVLPWKQ